MKDLTHYFSSPKEEESNTITDIVDISSGEASNNDFIEESIPPLKKRKISLSKSKLKQVKNKNISKTSVNSVRNTAADKKIEEKTDSKEVLLIDISDLKSKKRKYQADINVEPKKVKTRPAKNLKTSLKKYNSELESSGIDADDKTVSETAVQNSDSESKKNSECVPIEEENIFKKIECTDSSIKSKEQTKKKKSRKLTFSESEDETSSESKTSPTPSNSNLSIEKPLNNEKTNNSSRNSLFSYFNKVDKETVLKQKSEKIKVEALIHFPPSEGKSKQRLEKINPSKKSKKLKNKIQFDDSDTIEVICSENVFDENNSSSLNLQTTPGFELVNESITIPEETVKTIKAEPKVLASIFMTKKSTTDKSESKSDKRLKKDFNNCGKFIEVAVENETVFCEKQEKIKEKKNKHKIKSKSKKKPRKSPERIYVSSEESNSMEAAQSVRSKDKTDTSTKNNIKSQGKSNKLNGLVKTLPVSSAKKCTTSKILSTSNTRTMEVVEPSDTCLSNLGTKSHENPQKAISLDKNKAENDSRTPVKKPLTLNGYFTPNSGGKPCNKMSSEECKTKKSPQLWVMKVRLNTASKPPLDSEEDSKGSIEEVKETGSNSQAESGKNLREKEVGLKNGADSADIIPTEVVLVDDEEHSSDCSQENKSKRMSLPRNAKKPNSTSADETTNESPKPKRPVKVWPFFQKGGGQQTKAPPVDEAKLKAKMLFLESGVPEVIKRKVDVVKNESILGPPAPFPTVSHVMQAERGSYPGETSYRLPLLRCASPPLSLPVWSPLVATTDSEDSEIPVFERAVNVKTILKQQKEQEPKTEIKSLYKKLKEYKSKAETDIWTDVYKPSSSADMVGNSESIKKLKTWLETLKNRRRRESSESSGDEFVNEDSDGGGSNFNNMAVISGPCGCGKTSAVYAVANELDCKVLEINASCNRSGKRILAEFSESTQSHQVERAQALNSLFNNQSSGKSKKKKKSKLSPEAKLEKTSLILVEDADLLFADIDEGFMSALSSLAASSKRPLILVTNQSRNPHLERFNNSRLLQLNFSRPKPSKLGLWLRMIALVEGVVMTAEQASCLVSWNDCDVRRCLLQLQLMVHSNNSEVKETLTEGKLWWRWPAKYQLKFELPTLLEPEEEAMQPLDDKKALIKQLESVAQTTSQLAYLDRLSALRRLDGSDPCPVAWHTLCEDSTALEEPSLLPKADLYPSSHELGEWLAQCVARDIPSYTERASQTPQEARWVSILRQGEQYFMSGISSSLHTNHEAVTCDYFPALRDLGRAEQLRLANYTRRANRFFNYLQGLNIHASKSYRDFMCDAFS